MNSKKTHMTRKEQEAIADRDYADYMLNGPHGDWDYDPARAWFRSADGTAPNGQLSEKALKLWQRLKGTLTDAMLDKNDAARISDNTGLSLIDLYSMVYGVRVPNEKELLHLCDKLMME